MFLDRRFVLAWEVRGNHRYYYITQRVGKDAIKEYIGTAGDALAKLVAVSDTLVQQERAEAKQCIAIRRDAQHA